VFPDAQLAPEHAENSALYERVAFIVASPQSGAELVVRALGRLPGVVAAPVATNVFSVGLSGLLDAGRVGDDDYERLFGLRDLVDEQQLLWQARLLADELLAPLVGSGVLVEHSPGHIRSIDAISAVYPDAQVLHLVRDGGDVVGRLASPHRDLHWPRPVPSQTRPGWLARGAVEEWCDDQRAVDEFEDSAAYRVARIERILADPAAFLAWFAEGLGVDLDGDQLLAASEALGGGTWQLVKPAVGRAQALLNATASDLLERYDYPPAHVSEPLALASKLEVGYDHVTARAQAGLLRLSERLRALSERWTDNDGT
jgi:Sulfotransferase family